MHLQPANGRLDVSYTFTTSETHIQCFRSRITIRKWYIQEKRNEEIVTSKSFTVDTQKHSHIVG